MKIVVVGGGSAGYMSALQIQHKHPEWNITLIDSSKIGILGAGEGTTPVFAQTLKKLDLPIEEFVKYTGATVKNGLMFVGWGKDKEKYFHPFCDYTDTSTLSYFKHLAKTKQTLENHSYKQFKIDSRKNFASTIAYAIHKDTNLDKINLQTVINEYGNVIPDAHSWHIDAKKLVQFFNKYAVLRGIRVVDAVVDSFSTNTNDEIEYVIANGETILCDFLIDSTGFKRMFIGNHYNAEWVSTQDSLPCDSAIAFFMDMEKIQPYSEAIAMDFGWNWKTPLQHRWGCGYVYDSKYLSEDQAIAEINQKFGSNVKIVNKFKFKSGYYSNPWIKNCLAVGLSAGFFEPLEGTAILHATGAVEKFLDNDIETYLINKDLSIVQKYNEKMSTKNKDILDFLYLHYVTNKTNTDFWKNFTINNKMPETITKLLKEGINDLSLSSFIDTPGKIFNWSNWITVYVGNELYNKDKIKGFLDKQGEVRYTEIVKEIDSKKHLSIPLNKYLDNIINEGEKV
jgi:tryptophan halogenase